MFRPAFNAGVLGATRRRPGIPVSGLLNLPLFSEPAAIVPGAVFDDAAVNFGLTAYDLYGEAYNNGTGVTTGTYPTSSGRLNLSVTKADWLYDRATAFYVLYLRSGQTLHRDNAVALADLYFSLVVGNATSADFSTLTGSAGDIKYLYPIIANWYPSLTGGSTIHNVKAEGLYRQCLLSHSKTYNTGLALWTERNHSYAIFGCLARYHKAADATALADATDYFNTLITMSAAEGAPLHPYDQHEGGGPTTPITSPWMGALLVEAVVQFYRSTGDSRCITWLSNYGTYLVDHAFYAADGTEAGITGRLLPAYLIGTTLQYPEGVLNDMEHAYDVGVMLRKCKWAKQQLALSTAAIDAVLVDLDFVAAYVFNYWTRTTVGLPRYRVNPSRKYMWWFRNSYSSSFVNGILP